MAGGHRSESASRALPMLWQWARRWRLLRELARPAVVTRPTTGVQKPLRAPPAQLAGVQVALAARRRHQLLVGRMPAAQQQRHRQRTKSMPQICRSRSARTVRRARPGGHSHHKQPVRTWSSWTSRAHPRDRQAPARPRPAPHAALPLGQRAPSSAASSVPPQPSSLRCTGRKFALGAQAASRGSWTPRHSRVPARADGCVALAI